MDKTYELKRHRLEMDYWLFKARRDLIFQIIQRIDENINSRILDVGCAGGHLIKYLKERGIEDIYGVDISRQAMATCMARGIKSVLANDCLETSFQDNVFDIIIADNVLEHIETDGEALKEWNRILKNMGRLIITVPAFNSLWSGHDEICHHYRRYSKSALVQLLRSADFTVDSISFWNFTLFFPVYLMRVLQRWFSRDKAEPGDQLYELNPFINNLLFQLLRLENRILSWINFPVGISICAVARKKGDISDRSNL
jgi:methionine biosynthesis protein MetW